MSKFFNKKIFSILIFILIVIGVAAILRHQNTNKEMAVYMLYEEKQSDTCHSVVYGSLQEGVEAITNFISFLEINRLILEKPHPMQVGYIGVGDLQGRKNRTKFDYEPLIMVDSLVVDDHIEIWNGVLGYYYLHMGETNLAYEKLKSSNYYEVIKRFSKNTHLESFIKDHERIFGVPNWKADHPLDTNVFRAVDDMLRANADTTDSDLQKMKLLDQIHPSLENETDQ